MSSPKHGGDIYAFAKRLGISPDAVIDFSSNINRYRPKIGCDFNRLDVSRYADPNYTDLKKILAEKYGVALPQIAFFNGASSAIAALVPRFEEVAIYAPAYGEYRRFAKRVTLINRFEDLEKLPPAGALVVFVNPATPDGKFYDPEVLFSIWEAQNNTVLIDESFLEFTAFASATAFLRRYKKLYILKSLTKFYACAGVRVGVVLSHEANISEIEKDAPMWALSTYDVAYISEALRDETFGEMARAKLSEERRLLHEVLKKSPYVEKIYPSDANFFLVRLCGIDAEALQQKCDKEAILIRNCANFDFLDRFHVRFAVREREDIMKLARVLCGA